MIGASVGSVETNVWVNIWVTVVSWIVVRRLSWVITAVGTGIGGRVVETII